MYSDGSRLPGFWFTHRCQSGRNGDPVNDNKPIRAITLHKIVQRFGMPA
jgi:hypothetical protein